MGVPEVPGTAHSTGPFQPFGQQKIPDGRSEHGESCLRSAMLRTRSVKTELEKDLNYDTENE